MISRAKNLEERLRSGIDQGEAVARHRARKRNLKQCAFRRDRDVRRRQERAGEGEGVIEAD